MDSVKIFPVTYIATAKSKWNGNRKIIEKYCHNSLEVYTLSLVAVCRTDTH